MTKSFTQKKLEEFDKDFSHWVIGYLMADDAFDMDLREKVVRTEFKETLSESIEQARAEERKMIRDWVVNLPKGKTPAEEKIIQSIVDFLNNQDK